MQPRIAKRLRFPHDLLNNFGVSFSWLFFAARTKDKTELGRRIKVKKP